MEEFDSFLRFFWLDDQNAATPQNGVLPASQFPNLPAVGGDTLRFLVPASDLAGTRPESLTLHLQSADGQFFRDPIGTIRRQRAETETQLLIRVNAPVREGDYRQFAVLAEVPNPAYELTNLAINRPASASSAAATLATLFDGETDNYWSSESEPLAQHDEWIIIPLAEASRITALVLWARTQQGTHFPVDLRLDCSTDGVTYMFCRQWIGLAAPVGDKSLTLPLPALSNATHLRLTFSNLGYNPQDSSYRVQLGELEVTGYPLSQPPTIQANLLGTFRGQQTDLSDYVRAIRAFFESYTYSPVLVDEDGTELLVRIEHSERFRLGNANASIGLGDVQETNLNEPRLSVRYTGQRTDPAVTRYRVIVDSDLQPGNVFTLGGKSYTVVRGDSPATVLAALGLTDSTITVNSGTTPAATAAAGSYSQANRNAPGLTLLYQNAASGADHYRAVVTGTVQPGNFYQISAEGQATRSYTAVTGDSAATVAAYFNTETGNTFPVTTGKLPVGRTDAGSQLLPNTNRPGIRLTSRSEQAARQLDQYQVFIGNSIAAGNTFLLLLGEEAPRTSVALSGDQPVDIAGRLGYDTHPFTVEVPAGESVTGYAEPGPRYQSPANLASVDLLTMPVLQRSLPLVIEINIPATQEPGYYALVLVNQNGDVVAQSNRLQVLSSAKDTALLRYSDENSVFGIRYQEQGLVQQLRLPIYLQTPALVQSETLGQTPTGRSIRGETRLSAQRTLVTTAQPDSFHRAMWAALKHQYLQIDGVTYQQQGDYAQSDWLGYRKTRAQATTRLVDLRSYRDNQAESSLLSTGSETMGYALIDGVDVPPGLSVYLQDGSITQRIRPGSQVAPGAYQLQVRTGCEALAVAVYLDNVLAVESVLTAERLNRVDEYLVVGASQRVSIRTRPADQSVITTDWLRHRIDSAYSDEWTNEFEP